MTKAKGKRFGRKSVLALAVAAAVAGIAGVSRSVSAGVLYWTGSGTWDNGSTPDWGTTSGGPYTSVWTSGSDANFQGAAGTVTATTNITSIDSMTFATDGYIFSGAGGTLTLAGLASITTGGGTDVIGNNTSLVIGGTVGLSKNGLGTLTLNGTTANTFTGGLKDNAGTLNLDFSNDTSANLINSGNVLTLGGGNLTIKGNASGFTSQTFASTTIGGGGASAVINTNGGSGTALALGTITRTTAVQSNNGSATPNDGTIDFTLPSGTQSATNGFTTSNANNAGGILAGWATVNGGSTWATVSGGNIVGLTTYTTTTTNGNTAANYTSTQNIDVTSSPTLSGAATMNSLRFNTPGFNFTLSGNTTLTSSSILVTPYAGSAVAINAGTLIAGTGDLIINQFDSAGTLTIGSAITATGITVSGTGTVVLNNVATWVTVNSGATAQFNFNWNGNYDNNWLYLNGGTAITTASVDPGGNGNVIVGPDGGTIILNGFQLRQNNSNQIGVAAGATLTVSSTHAYALSFDSTHTTTNFLGNLAITGSGDTFDFDGATAANLNLLTATGVAVSGGAAFHNGDDGGNDGLGNVTGAVANNTGPRLSTVPLTLGGATLGAIGNAGHQGLGGTFTMEGGFTGTITQNLSTLTINSGLNTINSANTSGTSIVNLTFAGGNGGYVRNLGGILSVTSAAAGFTPGFTTAPTGPSVIGGVLVGATFGNVANPDTESFVSAASGTLSAPTYSTTNNAAAWAAALNTSVNTGGPVMTITANTNTNSVRWTGAGPIDLGGGTSVVATGMLLAADTGANGKSITDGNLTSGNGQDLILLNFDDAGSTITVSANIIDNGGTSIGLTYSGQIGSAVLSGNNTYTGPTFIEGSQSLTVGNAALTDSTLVYNNGGTGAIIFSGTTPTIGGLSGAQNLAVTAAVTALTIGDSNVNTVSPYKNPVYTGNLSGGTAMTLTKIGSNTQTLGGANTYTGATQINGGTLLINGSLVAASAVTVGGPSAAGTPTLGGSGTINGPVTISGTTTPGKLYPGAGLTTSWANLTIANSLNINAGTALAFNLNTISTAGNDLITISGANNVTFGGGGTLNVNAYAGTLALGNYLLINDPLGSINGGVAPTGWTFTQTGDSGHRYSFVETSPTQLFLNISFSTYTWTGHQGTSWDTGGSNQNWAIGGSYVAYSEPSSVVFTDTDAANGNATLSSPQSVVIQSSGVNPGSVIFSNSAVNYALSNSSGSIGIAGSATLLQNGNGTVTLNGANTFTGGTTISSGKMILGNAGALGANGSTVAMGGGAALDLASAGSVNTLNVTVTGPATISPDVPVGGGGVGITHTLGTLAIGANQLNVAGGANVTSGTAGLTFSAATTLSGAPTFNITNPIGGITLLTLGAINNGANTVTLTGNGNFAQTGLLGGGAGGLTLATGFGGTATLNQPNTYTGATTINSTSGGNLVLGNVTALGPAANATVTFGAASNGTLSLGGQTITVVGLNTNVSAGTPVVQNASGTAGTLTINVPNAITDTFAGTLRDGTGGGALALTLASPGSGKLVLSGSNNYSGPTSVNSGTLQVSNGTNGSATGSSTVAVASGATLTGNGTISGLVNIVGGGKIAQASGAELSVGSLDLNSNGSATSPALTFNVSGIPNAATPFVNVGGAFTINGSALTNITVTGTPQTGTYELFGFTGGNDPGTLSLNPVIPPLLGFNFTLQDTGSQINVMSAQNPLTWTNGSANNSWDTTGSVNWSNGSGPASATSYSDNALVTFSDNNTVTSTTLGSPQSVVVQGAGVNPFSVTFTNSGAVTYILSDGGAVGINGATGLLFNGTGTVMLNGVNSYTGGTTINSGSVILGNANALGSNTAASVAFGASSTGTLSLNGNNVTLVGLSTTSPAGGIVQSGSAVGGTDTLTLNLAAPNTFGGVLQDGGAGRLLALTLGAGTLTLNGANTNTGGINVNGGTLKLGATNTIGSSTPLAVGGGVLDLNSFSDTVASLSVTSGTAQATGGGTLTINGAGTATVSGGALSAALAVGSSGLLVNPAAGTAAISGGVTGTGNVTITSTGAATAAFSANPINVTGTITNNGTSTGASTIGGGVGANVTSITENSTTSALNITTNTLTVGSTTTLTNSSTALLTVSGGVAGTGNLVLNNNSNAASGITLSGSINNTGTITDSGTGVTGNVVTSGGTPIASVNISGAIGNNVTGIFQNSTSDLVLGGNNGTYTHGITITSGRIDIANYAANNNTALGAAGDVVAIGSGVGGGTAILNYGGGMEGFGSAVTIAGSLTVGGTGSDYITASDWNPTFSGLITLGNNLTIASLNANDSSITFTGGVTGTGNITVSMDYANANGGSFVTFSGASVNNSGTLTFNNAAVLGGTAGTVTGTSTISAIIGANVQGIVENSTNPLLLSGPNLYVGPTTVQTGTLLIGVSNVGTTSGATGPSTNTVSLGFNGGTTAASILTNGAFNFTNPINVIGGDSGTLTIGGNSGNASTFGGLITLANNVTLNQVTGGTLTVNSGITGTGNVALTTTGTGGITLSGGTINNTGNITISNSGTGAVTLSALSNTGVITNNGSGTNTTTIGGIIGTNVTGGVTENSANSILKLTASNTYTGPTTITTGKLLIPQGASLANTAIAVGNGVSVGTLAIQPTTGNTIALGGSLTVNSGSTFDMSGDSNTGTVALAGNLSATGGTFKFDLGNTGGVTGVDLLASGGSATVTGSNTITIVSFGTGAPTLGSYNLITAAGNGLNGPGSFTLSDPALTSNGTFYALSLNNSAGVESLTVGFAPALTWTGNAGNGTWDVNNNLNWANTTAPTAPAVYTNSTLVSFNNTSTITGGTITQNNITIGSTVTPLAVIFNNTNLVNYTLGGAAGIGGGGTLLTKNFNGTVTLTGSNSYTGATTVNAGTLKLDFTVNNPASIISSSSPLVLAGGIFAMNGNGGGSTQTVNGLTVSPGASAVTDTSNGAASTLNLGAITRTTGGTVNFVAPAAGNIVTSTPNSTALGSTIIGGYATFGADANGNGTTWAVSGTGTTAGAITGLTTYTTGLPGGGTTNANIDATASGGIGSGATFYSLRFNTAAAVSVGPGTAGMTLISGGILETSNVGANASTISNGAPITSGNGTDLIVIQNNTASSLTITGNVVNNGATPIGLTKSGPGVLLLTDTGNTFSGVTTINAGTLKLSSGSTNPITGTPTISIASGATLDVTGLTNGAIALAAAQTLKGIGAVSGGVTTVSGTTISPGFGNIGTLSETGNLKLVSGTNLSYWLGAPGTLANPITSSVPGSSGLIAVGGSLTLASGINLHLNDNANANSLGSMGAGFYELFSYTGTLTGYSPSDFTITSSLSGLRDYTISNNTIGGINQIDLNISAPLLALTWTGVNSDHVTNNTSWDTTAGSTNWSNAGAASNYVDGDFVTFQDTDAVNGGNVLPANRSVSIQSAGVNPSSVSFTNTSAVSYTLSNASGIIGIAGATGVTINGGGTVTFTSPNTYTGTTALSGGSTLVISDNADLGSASTTIAPVTFTGATLQYAPSATNPDISGRTVTIGAGGATIDLNDNPVTYANAIGNNGTGGLTLASTTPGGKLTLNGANTYSGGSTLDANTTLNIKADSGLGTAPGTPTTNLTFAGNSTLQQSSVTPGTLTVNPNRSISIANGATATFDTQVAGNTLAIGSTITGGNASSAIAKINPGTLALSGTNNYAGGTTITGGVVSITNPGALGGGTVYLNGGGSGNPTLRINGMAPQTPISGFTAINPVGATNFTQVNDAIFTPTINTGTLQITSAVNAESNNVWYNSQVGVSNFTAQFTYQESGGAGNPADGVSFILQSTGTTNTAGTNGQGGNWGFGGGGLTSPSAALAWNIWMGTPIGITEGTNGALGTVGTTTTGGTAAGTETGGGVSVASGNPIQFTVSDPNGGATLFVTMKDTVTNGTFTGSVTLASALSALFPSGSAYVGFGGSTGGVNSVQTISGFNYSTLGSFTSPFTAANNIDVATDSTIDMNSTSGAVTFGALAINGSTLNITNASGGGASLTLGATTLSGSPTFNTVNNGGTTALTLGALNDSGVGPQTITFSGTGAVTLGSAANTLVNGTTFNVTGGTLNSNNATALGSLPLVNIASGATVALGASQTFGELADIAPPVVNGGKLVLNANTLTFGDTSNKTFSGVISDGTGGSGSIIKVGSGAMTFAGASTYTGTTSVNAGTLLVNGSLANTAVSVGGNGTSNSPTIGGTGAINGPLTVNGPGTGAAGILWPGAGGAPSTLTVNSDVTLNPGSFFDVTLTGNLTSGNDQVLMNGGNLTIGANSGANVTVNITPTGELTVGNYVLISNTGSISVGSNLALAFTNGDDIGHLYTLGAVGTNFDLTVASPLVVSISTPAGTPRIIVGQNQAVSGTYGNVGATNINGVSFSGSGLAATATINPTGTFNLNSGSTGNPFNTTLAATGSGTQAYGITLSNGTNSGTANASLDVVTMRTITNGVGTDLGPYHAGAAILATVSTAFSTVGSHDTTTEVSVAAGSGVADSNGVILTGGPTDFDATGSDTRTFGGTAAVSSSGGSFNLAVSTKENLGAGLPGEGSYSPVNVAYTISVYSGKMVWTGATDTSYGTGGNWNDTAPGGYAHVAPGLDSHFTTTDTALFGATSSPVIVTLDGSSPSLNAMTFNTNGNYTITQGGGGSITLAGAAPTITVAGTQFISAPVVLNSSTTATTITVTNLADSLTLAGVVSDNGSGLTKAGNGSLVLSGSTTYSGATSVTGGKLVLNSYSGDTQPYPVELPSSSLTAANGTVDITANANFNYFGDPFNVTLLPITLNAGGVLTQESGQIAYLGSVTLAGGTLTSAGAPFNATFGAWILGTGTTVIAGGGAVPTSVISASVIGLTNDVGGSSQSTTFTVTTSSGSTNGIDLDVTGTLADGGFGTGQLIKAGTGTMRLDGNNTYSGGTVINAGTVQVTTANSLGTSTGAVAINSGTLEATANITESRSFMLGSTTSTIAVDSGKTYEVDGLVSDGLSTGTLNVSGPGKLLLTNGNNSYSGGTNINSGTLQVANTGGSATGNSTVQVNNTGTLMGSSTANQGFISGPVIVSGGTVAGSSGAMLTLNGGLTLNAGSNSLFALGTPNNTSNPLVNVTLNNGFSVTGSNIITVSGGQAGTYDLIGYTGTFSDFGNFNLTVNGPASFTYALHNNTGGNQIDLMLTAVTLTWTGAANTSWDTNGVNHNWANNTPAAAVYSDGEAVIFGDTNPITSATLSSPQTVNIQPGGVNPGSVVFDNTTAVSYTLTGGGATGIGGATGVTLNGTGTVIFQSANTYTGATAVNAGILNIQNGTALGTSSAITVANNATLQIQSATGIAGGSQLLTLSGNGAAGATGALENVGGNNSYAGLILLNASSTIASDAGSLSLSNTGTITGSSAALTLTGSGNGTIAGNINTGITTLTKNGTGTWTLTGSNTYSGATAVNAGILNIQNSADFGVSSAITVANNATLQIQSATTINGGNQLLTLSGNGAAGGTGALENVSGTNSYAGLLALNASSTIASDAGTLNLTNAGTITGSGDSLILTGSGYGGIASAIGTGSGGLTKSGSGTWLLVGATTYTGATMVTGGTLLLDYSNGNSSFIDALPSSSLTIGNGTVDITANANWLYFGNIDNTHFSSSILPITINAGGVLTQENNQIAYLGTLTLAGGTLTSVGTPLNADGAWIFGSGAAVNAGGGAVPTSVISAASIGLANANGNTTTFTVSPSTGSTNGIDLDVSSTIVNGNPASGGGILAKSGTGTMRLDGANTYTGGTNVLQGRLLVDNTSGSGTGSGPVIVSSGATLGGGFGADTGATNANISNGVYAAGTVGTISGPVTIQSGGHLAPGNSVGTLSVNSLTLNAGSILDYEFNLSANDFTAVTASNGLTINGGGFNLYQEGTSNPFHAVGTMTYHLIGYSGAIQGGGVSDLSVLNPIGGDVYAFSNNPTLNDVDLTITGPSRSASMTDTKDSTTPPAGFAGQEFSGTSHPGGSYDINVLPTPGYLNNISPTSYQGGGLTGGMADKGYVTVNGLADGAMEFIALAIQIQENGGSSESLAADPAALNAIVSDLNASSGGSYTASVFDANGSPIQSRMAFGEGYYGGEPFDIFISTTDPQVLAFDFSNEVGLLTGTDGLVTYLSITDIGVLPEPTSLGILGVGAMALLARKRKHRA